jgi:hypothetical protein
MTRALDKAVAKPAGTSGRAVFEASDTAALSASLTGAVNMDAWSPSLYNPTINEFHLGKNIRPTPVYDTDSLLTGKGNILVGQDILTTANDRATISIGIGNAVLGDAVDVYGMTMMGFRTGSKLVGATYGTGYGIDCFSFTTSLDASTAVGAHCCTYKDTVNLSFSAGTIANSIVIGYTAGAGNIAAPTTVYSYSDCILIGNQAGTLNKADKNIFIGSRVAQTVDVTGGHNIGLGNDVLTNLSSGIGNVMIGDTAGKNISTGQYNVFLGYLTGASLITGNRNTALGFGSGPNGDFTNTSCIGNNALANASNVVVLGDTAITSLRCAQTSITAISDQRDKIEEGDGRLPIDALDFINNVTVRWFKWNMRDGTDRGDAPEAGVFAQELDTIQTDFGVDFGLVDKTNPDRLEASPHKLLFPLIEAVQKLSAKVEAQAAEIAALKALTTQD